MRGDVQEAPLLIVLGSSRCVDHKFEHVAEVAADDMSYEVFKRNVPADAYDNQPDHL